MNNDGTCTTCVEVTGTRRYCAPARCYCGHDACPAFASYIDLSTVALSDAPTSRTKDSWTSREESTWIDKL